MSGSVFSGGLKFGRGERVTRRQLRLKNAGTGGFRSGRLDYLLSIESSDEAGGFVRFFLFLASMGPPPKTVASVVQDCGGV